MKKLMYLIIALVCITLTAPVMADPGKNKHGHGKHKRHKSEPGVVVVQPPPSNVVIKPPSVVVKPPRVIIK